jgi:hypothetical protein
MQSISELQIGLDILLGAGSGVLGAMGAYYKLKTRLDLSDAKNDEQEKELADLRERKKEMNMALHKRIDDQKNEITTLQKEVHTGHSSLEKQIAQLELRIVEKFQASVKEIVAELKRA